MVCPYIVTPWEVRKAASGEYLFSVFSSPITTLMAFDAEHHRITKTIQWLGLEIELWRDVANYITSSGMMRGFGRRRGDG